MIVQITMVRNERPLLEKMLPIWKKFADAFVFMVDTSTDGTLEYLNSIKHQYNILDILEYNEQVDQLRVETDNRQLLFNTARAYSNKIICLDADEYLDGELSKLELTNLLDSSPDTVFYLQWIQYTSINSIRVDGPWKNNYKDRIGSYKQDCAFTYAQMHSTHLPIPTNQQAIDPSKLFIAHLQWLDKNFAAIKQYYWKIVDYVNQKQHNIEVTGISAYDISVADFNWEEEYFPYQLKIPADLFEDFLNQDNYRLKYIIEQSQLHNIPNLGDWGYNFKDSIPMNFCTAADDKHYPLLLNMIGSIHHHNFYDTVEIRVYDLGLTTLQKAELANLKKVKICEIEMTNPQLLTYIETGMNRQVRGLFAWKSVLIKDSLDHHDYVLYLDAGTTILKPLNQLFKHIKQNGYLLFDCGHSIKKMTTDYLINKFDLLSQDKQWILEETTFGIDAGFMGISREIYDEFVLPMYEYSKDMLNFTDNGTCPDGWGYGRHDQTLFSILARKNNYNLIYHDNKENECYLIVDNNKIPFHITHTSQWVTDQTTIFRSRWNINYTNYKQYTASTKRLFKLSVITAIGSLSKYDKFLPNYFSNITNMIGYNMTEFIIVYNEWSPLFDKYINSPNFKFIKDTEQTGVYNAWNIGIKHATSEYVTNWNIDDIRFEINNIIKYDLLSKNPEIDLVYSYYLGVFDNELDTVDLKTKKPIEYPDNFHEQVLLCCMAGPDPMWRKSAHMFVGLFDPSYNIIGDWEMWVRMAAYGMKFKLIPYSLGIYVDHDNTISKSNFEELDKQKLRLQQQYS
jgi:hypothetical protein